MEPSREQRIWQVVSAIPQGKVVSYGQVAAMAGLGRQARFVGRTLHQLPEGNELPWHRVLRADGRIALAGTEAGDEQVRRLRQEGVDVHGYRIDLKRFQWTPA